MKKVCTFILMMSICLLFTSACTKHPQKSIVQSKRRFAQYVEPNQVQKDKNIIDLSEGPKLHYDANLGPKNLNFDIKIVDPY